MQHAQGLDYSRLWMPRRAALHPLHEYAVSESDVACFAKSTLAFSLRCLSCVVLSFDGERCWKTTGKKNKKTLVDMLKQLIGTRKV